MKDDQGQNHYAVEPFVPGHETPDEGSESVIIRLMARMNCRRDSALEMIDEVMEAFGQRDATPKCEADGNPLKKLNSLHQTAWKHLIEYQANQKTADDVRMSTRVMALELGFNEAAGAENVAQLAKKIKTIPGKEELGEMLKQTVNKCALNFQRLMGLQRRAGQRGDDARANMAKARINQVLADGHQKKTP